MTEAEWLECDRATLILEFVRGKASGRKLRLFAAACLGRSWGGAHLAEPLERWMEGGGDSQYFDEVLEQLDQEAFEKFARYRPDLSPEERLALWPTNPECYDQFTDVDPRVLWSTACQTDAWQAARDISMMFPRLAWSGGYDSQSDEEENRAASAAESRKQTEQLRDIFGNPFRPPSINPSWQTPTVVILAHAAYDNRLPSSGELDLARFAVLADALEEAGCPCTSRAPEGSRPGHEQGKPSTTTSAVLVLMCVAAGWSILFSAASEPGSLAPPIAECHLRALPDLPARQGPIAW